MRTHWAMAVSISSPAPRSDWQWTTPDSESIATSVVPPPMSTTMLPPGSVMGIPAPIAAAMGSSIRYTSRAPACIAESRTARFSTCVIPEGTPITIRGRTSARRRCTRRMKYPSIFSVTSKSAITPSLSGRTAWMWDGVRPIIRLASLPTARTAPDSVLMATTDGSLRTMPACRT